MTADEIRFIVASTSEVTNYAIISGRYSSLLMIPFSKVLSFADPTFFRYCRATPACCCWCLGIFLLLRRLGFSGLVGMALTAFILITHELDWQHNGLIAFFGIYNALLAIFLIAMLSNERKTTNNGLVLALTALFIGSYASELFVGLSLSYLILKVLLERQLKPQFRSPIFWSLAIYISAYVVIKATTALTHWNAQQMSNYLVGSVGTYAPDQMLMAALLYFINSLPYYHLLEIQPLTSAKFAALILFALGAYIILLLPRKERAGQSSLEFSAQKREWLMLAMLVLLAVVPNFLMALQPMKVDWILRNASVHYAFSYYTWIALAIVFAHAARRTLTVIGSAGARLGMGVGDPANLPWGVCLECKPESGFPD